MGKTSSKLNKKDTDKQTTEDAASTAQFKKKAQKKLSKEDLDELEQKTYCNFFLLAILINFTKNFMFVIFNAV